MIVCYFWILFLFWGQRFILNNNKHFFVLGDILKSTDLYKKISVFNKKKLEKIIVENKDRKSVV